jgi:predicted transcriptional regulator
MDKKTKEKLISYIFYQKRFQFLQLINDKEQTLSKFIRGYNPDCSIQWFSNTIKKFIEGELVFKSENNGKRGKPLKLTDKGKEVLEVLEKINAKL